MASSAITSNAICGVWIEEDKNVAKRIKDYLVGHLNEEIIQADLRKLSFLQEDRKYSKYLVLLSNKSVKNHQFMVFLTSVLYHMYYLKLISKVVLVITNKEFNERAHLPINLHTFDRIHVKNGEELTEDNLQNICQELAGAPKKLEEFLPVGNMGIGLAWSYFYGYLNLILPGLEDRINQSDVGKRNGDKMSKKFFVLIPESCRTPERFSEVDKRFVPEGPLDGGFYKSRAGHPTRSYNNFVHRIKGNNKEADKYFCGEFATPVLALWKMLKENKIDQNELNRQVMLFKYTLAAIVNNKRNPFCFNRSCIISYKEESDLADMLYNGVGNEEAMIDFLGSEYTFSLTVSTSTRQSIGSFVDIETITVVSADDGEQWKEALFNTWNIPAEISDPEDASAESNSFNVKESTFEDILPRLEYPSIVDVEGLAEKAASNKLFIILTQGLKNEMETYANALIHHPIWFPRTTILLDVDEAPAWLEKSGVDYIDTRKGNQVIWKRMFGSVYGTSSVSGGEGTTWKIMSEGKQRQKDKLPVGHVAEGLALGYYLNYLDIIGPTMAERIKKTEQFTAGLMPSKLFILLPYSCYSHPTLADADENITSAGKLETLTVQIAGNNRKYDTAMHKICANGKEYFACVEYCTPVLVMYEMEAEGKAGLTPKQKEAQLQVFYQFLQKLYINSIYSQDIQLICYDDQSLDAKTLSSILVENIEKWL